MSQLPLILSIVPLVLFVILLLHYKLTLFRVSFITLIATALLAVFYWQIEPSYAGLSFGKGFFIALDIAIIVAGAIFFLNILTRLNILDNISRHLENISKDYRVQVLILAWLFESFLEGTAGFGTPAAVVAPLLIAIGLPPLKAVIIGLLGNSTAVVFGAAGTPIRVGFAGLDIAQVPGLAVWLNFIGLIVPVFILWTLVADRREAKKEFFEALPFALWTGFAFVLPSALAVGLGQEFPSIIGGLIGLGLVIFTIRFKIFTPLTVRRIRDVTIVPNRQDSLWLDFLPYFILVALLVAGKFLVGAGGLAIPLLSGQQIAFFNPGYAFIIAGALTAIFWRVKFRNTARSAGNAIAKTLGTFAVIAVMSSLVQIMINAKHNLSGLASPIEIIAKVFEVAWLPFLAPFVGAFGSFLTGSATVSNLLFGNFFSTAAQALNFDTAKILALGVVGAAAGNMIALADILAAETVVGLRHQERAVLRGVIIPCLVYLTLAGAIGLLIV